MTPDEEARFIALWQTGASHVAIAAALGIPVGTVKSRAHTLQQQGKIQARPRGASSPCSDQCRSQYSL
jgi:DNA-directed RNA polymerase specialized sigma24 family protein